MKNIHLIPTDKLSKLKQNKITKKLSLVNKGIDLTAYTPINIYITSDEEIKEGDWVYCRIENRVLVSNVSYSKLDNRFKIILTTDQDLINDGVQAIDDEFLEWFVKNPSCEEVEVENKKLFDGFLDPEYGSSKWRFEYKIIIPKEEPEQYNNLNYGGGFTEEDIKRVSEKELKQENCCTPIGQIKKYLNCVGCDQKPKQETLEEAAKNYAKQFDWAEDSSPQIDFIEGAKWQAERMYSDMEEYAEFCINCYEKGLPHIRSKDWFEQFKKK